MMGGSLGGWSQGAFGQSANTRLFARDAEVSIRLNVLWRYAFLKTRPYFLVPMGFLPVLCQAIFLKISKWYIGKRCD